MFKFAAAALAATMCIGSAQATVITFDTSTPISPFTGTYTQDAFDIKYLSGALKLGIMNNLGNVIYSSSGGSGSFELSRVDGGVFSLASFLGGGNGTKNAGATFNILGYLGGANTYSETFSAVTTGNAAMNTFNTAPTENVFDRIIFSMAQSPKGPGSSIKEVVIPAIDSINVTALAPPQTDPVTTVPEPATWAMMIGGFGMVGGAMRRRRGSARFA